MNETTLSIGDNFNNSGYSISKLSDIDWLFAYSGTWIKICPGFFEYGQNLPPNKRNVANAPSKTSRSASATRTTTIKPSG